MPTQDYSKGNRVTDSVKVSFDDFLLAEEELKTSIKQFIIDKAGEFTEKTGVSIFELNVLGGAKDFKVEALFGVVTQGKSFVQFSFKNIV